MPGDCIEGAFAGLGGACGVVCGLGAGLLCHALHLAEVVLLAVAVVVVDPVPVPGSDAPEFAKAHEATQDPEPDEGVLGVRRG